MKKFYEKSEIWFAVTWIFVYVMVMGNVRNQFGDGSIWSLLTLLTIAGVMTLFILQNKLTEKYGFIIVRNHKKYCYFIPFALLITVNFWAGAALHYDAAHQVIAVLTMAMVGYVEEVLFRGFLYKAIEKENTIQAIIISAVTFGAGHIVNLLTGHATIDTLLQMAYAIAIGFAFVMVFYRSKSILPCIITHSLIDITSTFSNESTRTMDYIASAFIIIVAGGYAFYLYKKGDTAN